MAEAKDAFRFEPVGEIRPRKLKGHVKIIQRDIRTGKITVEEGDNIITDAVADIYSQNYMGGIDYTKTMPLWEKYFGGLLCYKDPFATSGSPAVPDPADYFPQGNDINELIAHAGPTVPSGTDLQEDRKRGYRIDYVQQAGKIKQVFEFGSLQGNGVISALALTHRDTGDAGTGSTSTVFKNFNPFDEIQGSQMTISRTGIERPEVLVTQYDDNHGLMYLIGEDGDYQSHPAGYTSGTNKVTVYIRRLSYKKAGLFENTNAVTTDQIKFTVTTTMAFYIQPSYYFDYTNKKLWLFSNITGYSDNAFQYSKTNINYAVIDCENGTVDSEGTIISDASDIAPLCQQNSGIVYMMNKFINIIKEGNDFYFPTTTNGKANDITAANVTGYKRINTSSGTQETLSFNETQALLRPSVKGGGLIINSGRIINGGVGYTCLNFLPENNIYYSNYGFNQPDKINNYVVPIGSFSGTGGQAYMERQRLILANKLIHTTKYNMQNPITKDTSKSLTVEYTLEEVTT